MRCSKLYAPTLREVPAEAEVISQKLMLRAGFMRKSAAGMYTYLPLAWRVLKKIENIVREEMDAAGSQELLMPIVQPASGSGGASRTRKRCSLNLRARSQQIMPR